VRTTWLIIAVTSAMVLAADARSIQLTRQELTRLETDVSAFLQAARSHTPGSLDEPARRTAALPWTRLNRVIERVIAGGDEAVLVRAGTMLTDIARHIPLADRPQNTRVGRSIIAEDGDRRGSGFLDPHLSSARRLIDRIVLDPRAPRYQEMRAHAIAWYRAVSAWLASQLNLADLEPHVERSLVLFPDVAAIAFDAGCYFETYASDAVQVSVLAEDPSSPAHRRPADLMRAYATSSRHLLATADGHYERATILDPTLAEAYVRLGRVRTVRGQVGDGVARLRQASSMEADVTVQYFTHLFLGDALDRGGDRVGAEAAYRWAAGLVPGAQSPRLAISRLAADTGNLEAARAALEQLFQGDPGFDPWWAYQRCTGRDVDAIMAAYAARIDAVADRGPVR
jgi:tetratricopeptide (TPR) repeat protein